MEVSALGKRIYDKYVLQIAVSGSLNKAAAELHLSQPALSSGLSSLEKELGFRIFDRSCTPVVFTPEGWIYFEYLKRMQVLTRDMERRVQAVRDDRNREAIIGSPVAYTETIVADAVCILMGVHPEYHVTVRSAQLNHLIRWNSEGAIHCFISTSPDLPEPYEKKHIKDESIFLCVPASWPINEELASFRASPSGSPIDYRLLDGLPFIALEHKMPLQQQVDAFMEENGLRPQLRITVDQVSSALRYAARGQGMCFASEEALFCGVNTDDLRVYPLPPSFAGRQIYIAYDPEMYLSEACRDLIDVLSKKTDSLSSKSKQGKEPRS